MTTPARDLPLLQTVARIAARIAEREAAAHMKKGTGTAADLPVPVPLSAAIRPADESISPTTAAPQGEAEQLRAILDASAERAA